MKAIHQKMSLILAGFLNSMSFFPFSCDVKGISERVGSLKQTFQVSNNGFDDDRQNLGGDWLRVQKDIRKSFDIVTNESTEQAAEGQSA